MLHCNQCNQTLDNAESRCPHCGSLNSKIDSILAREAAETESKTIIGRIKIILRAENKKQALLDQLKLLNQSLTNEGLFALFVIIIFIYAMTSKVL